MSNFRNVAIVLAGGTGTRVGLNIPKQLIKISGKPIIEHTIATMQASQVIDDLLGCSGGVVGREMHALAERTQGRHGIPDGSGATVEHPVEVTDDGAEAGRQPRR